MASAPLAMTVGALLLAGGPALGLPVPLVTGAVAAGICVVHAAWIVALAVRLRPPKAAQVQSPQAVLPGGAGQDAATRTGVSAAEGENGPAGEDGPAEPGHGTTAPADPRDGTSAPDLRHGTTTPTDPRDGTATTTDQHDGMTTTPDPRRGTTTTTDPRDGTSTTTDPGDGTTTTPDPRDATRTPAGQRGVGAVSEPDAGVVEAPRRAAPGQRAPGDRYTSGAWHLDGAPGTAPLQRQHPDRPAGGMPQLVTAAGLPDIAPARRGGVFSLWCLAAGLAGAAASLVALPVAGWVAPLAGAALVVGLLRLPGVTVDAGAAVRRGLDGVCVALWKFLTLLVLILDVRGKPGVTVFTTCLLAVLGITVAVVSGVRAPFPRWAAVTAAGGVALVVLGLAVLPLLPAQTGRRDTWLLVAGSLVVLGAVLVWAGAHRSVFAGRPAARRIAEGTLIGDPLLVAPVLAGAASVLYTLVTRGQLGLQAMVVGTVAVLAVAVRELLEAVALRRYSGQLEAQEVAFRTLVAGSSDVIMVLDPDLSVRWQSPAAARRFGLSDQEVIGRPFRLLVPEGLPSGAEARRVRIQDGFGVRRHVEVTVTDRRDDPEFEGLVVHLRDVGAEVELEHSLQRTARIDPLTGLVNRAELLRHLDRGGYLLAIGLDGFAGVNDVHGPDRGDALLVEVAARIRGAAGPRDVAARLNGDEFAVYTTVDRVHAVTLARRLLAELGETYTLGGTTLQLSAGIGLAAVGDGPEESLHRAGLALRRAKHSGRGRIEWHDAELEEAYVRRATVEQDLPLAAERGELDLAYQPVYDLVEGHPIGVEALLRWRHPKLGTVAPAETLAAARALGLTGQIHDWVLKRACRQLSLWQHEGYRLWMSVNVAIDDLVAPGFATRMSLTLDSHQIDPADLVVELSEQELGVDLDRAAEPLATVRAIGVRIALDGFGTGATSLAHLRRLPTDVIKVSGSLFTQPPAGGGQVAPIIDVVVKLGRRLNVTVVAHGLEAQRHLEVVRSAGCRYGQGNFYGPPGPAERIEAELVRQRTW